MHSHQQGEFLEGLYGGTLCIQVAKVKDRAIQSVPESHTAGLFQEETSEREISLWSSTSVNHLRLL